MPKSKYSLFSNALQSNYRNEAEKDLTIMHTHFKDFYAAEFYVEISKELLEHAKTLTYILLSLVKSLKIILFIKNNNLYLYFNVQYD